MKPGCHRLSAEERLWLREICKGDIEGTQLAVPEAVAQRLLEHGLIEPSGSSYVVTVAGLAEALRTL